MSLHKFIIFTFAILLFSLASANTLDEIGSEILEQIWNFHPVDATYLGIHKYDTLLPDYSKNSLKKMLSRFKKLRQNLDELDTLSFSVDELVDYHLLKIDLADEIFDLEIMKSYRKNPLIYVTGCINSIYAILIRSAPSTSAKINAIKKRLGQISGFLKNAKQNLKHPPQILCEIGIDQLDEGEELIEDIFSTYKDSISENEKKDFQQTKARAIAAMKLFAMWLEKNGDSNSAYTLGQENYEYMLTHIHLLDINADSLLNLGKNVLDSTNRMIDSLENLLQEPERQSIALPPDFGKNDVMAYRKQEIDFMRDYVAKSNLVTVPDWIGKLEVVETPGFLRTIIPSIAMQPSGPFDDSNTSYFYVKPLPDEFELSQAEYYYNYIQNHWFRSSIVHEGYPGHHLQLSIANRHLSIIRKSFYDNFFIEGWALYCEELMVHSGIYKDTLGAIINALRGVRFRAVRIIIDVMLQTRQYSYEDAVNFMVTTLKGNPIFYAREVKRYITDPGQASSYLVGKLQILDLLDDYKKAMADKFILKNFHDKLISHGSIPIKLIRRIMMSEIK